MVTQKSLCATQRKIEQAKFPSQENITGIVRPCWDNMSQDNCQRADVKKATWIQTKVAAIFLIFCPTHQTCKSESQEEIKVILSPFTSVMPLHASLYYRFSSVQSLSRVQLFATPCSAACQASLSITNSGSLLKLMYIESVMPSNHLSSPSPPAFNLSQHQDLFQWVSSSHQVAKVSVSASATVLPMNIQDWFPLGWTGWIFLQSEGLSRVFSNTTV